MTYKFTEDKIAALQAAQATGDWGHAYRVLYETITLPDGSGPKDGVSKSAWLWIDGAHDVNQDIGDFSTFIRNFTSYQMDLRLADPVSDDIVQDASDGIARSVFDTILENAESGGAAYLPNIYELGLKDAASIARDVFGGDSAGWAGNSLFIFLGEDTFFENIIIDGNRPIYNTFALLNGFRYALGESGGLQTKFSMFIDNVQTMRGNDIGIANSIQLAVSSMGSIYTLTESEFGISFD